MTSPYLTADLQRDEGLRLDAYPDPLSGGAPWTIGYGHTGPEVARGLVWTDAQACDALALDIAAAARGLDATQPWWRGLDDLRQDCLVNMAFNLGVHGLGAFASFLAYMRGGDFARAALDLTGTPWCRQVGARAQRIVAQIRTGMHQP
jgi:lysozyme